MKEDKSKLYSKSLFSNYENQQRLISELKNEDDILDYIRSKSKYSDQDRKRILRFLDLENQEKYSRRIDNLTKFGIEDFEAKEFSYEKIRKVNKAIKSSNDIGQWIKTNYPKQYKDKISPYFNNSTEINTDFTGKWIGEFKSYRYGTGEFVFALCFLDNKIYGRGALINSIFDEAFVEGEFKNMEISLKLFGEYQSEICNLKGVVIKHSDLNSEIIGKYNVLNSDDGIFKAFIDTEKIQNNDIEEINKIRELIASANLKRAIENLRRISNKNPDEYLNEIILLENKINKHEREKRLGIKSNTDLQIEDAQIVYSFLNLLSEIELKILNK